MSGMEQHLRMLEDRARLALEILDGVDEDEWTSAEEFLLGGYAHESLPGSSTIALLAVGGPTITLEITGTGYSLSGYAPGHRTVSITSPTITAWGRFLVDAATGSTPV